MIKSDHIGIGEGEQGVRAPPLEVIRADLEHIRANLKIFGRT